MADINSRQPGSAVGAAEQSFASPTASDTRLSTGNINAEGDPDALLRTVELLFFAYRDFTGEADAVLSQFEFGRAHHRVLHFVSRRPGIRVANLLDILRITKQSLARVLKQLLDRGFIVQEAGEVDRRERHLFLTDKGRRLADELGRLQTAQISRALAAAGPSGDIAVRAFLLAMVADDHRAELGDLIGSASDLPAGEDCVPPLGPPSLGHDGAPGSPRGQARAGRPRSEWKP
jgi:DNA-binding MarR family transcriptional regulator